MIKKLSIKNTFDQTTIKVTKLFFMSAKIRQPK